ncbi:MAG: hypothetical protein K8S94_15715 [Planctomycetia bacterium]|nr:hypothetical protein [Planctomycetia bacterium]
MPEGLLEATEPRGQRISLMAVAIIVLLATGCRPTGHDRAATAPRGTIGVSLLALDNPFFKKDSPVNGTSAPVFRLMSDS